MVILCVDRDAYCRMLNEALRARGGEAVVVSLRDAADALGRTEPDAVIFDPANEDAPPWTVWSGTPEGFKRAGPALERDPDPYFVLRQLTESDWGRSHEVVVFTRVPRGEFEIHARGKGIDPQRVRYYCKSDLEIPPILRPIQQMILENPYGTVGYDCEEHVPDAITAEWIGQERYLTVLLEKYLLDYLENWDEAYVLSRLPTGFTHLNRLLYMCGQVENGGFGQYLGNSLLSDETGQSIVETLGSLRVTGSRLATLLERAIELSATWVPGRVTASTGVSFPPALETEEETAKKMDAVDSEFYQLDGSWLEDFGTYVRLHPQEFIHHGGAEP